MQISNAIDIIDIYLFKINNIPNKFCLPLYYY